MFSLRQLRRFFLILFFLSLLFFFMHLAETKWMPTIIAISHMNAQSISNRIIDESVNETLDQWQLDAADLITTTNHITTADTLTINALTSAISQKINQKLHSLPQPTVSVPLGILTGLDLLSNQGPCVTFRLMELGQTQVDYETSFSSAGINQTHYQVYLTVHLQLCLVNPLQKQMVATERKIMLIDAVMEGDVPQGLFPFQ